MVKVVDPKLNRFAINDLSWRFVKKCFHLIEWMIQKMRLWVCSPTMSCSHIKALFLWRPWSYDEPYNHSANFRWIYVIFNNISLFVNLCLMTFISINLQLTNRQLTSYWVVWLQGERETDPMADTQSNAEVICQ